MPRVTECRKYGMKGYKAGVDGFCHLYKPDDQKSKRNAYKKALADTHLISEQKAYRISFFSRLIGNI